jgi:toxin secretion/phage lysis holin
MKLEQIDAIIEAAWNSDIIKVMVLFIVMDIVFGVIRATKEKKFNSCVGIDGAVRKTSMVVSIAFLLILDKIADLNLMNFLPEEVHKYLGSQVGSAEFFGILYIAYELVSILKNMTLCGLPVKGIWEKVEEWLRKYTNELPGEKQ